MIASSVAAARTPAVPTSPDYRLESTWLCLPGRKDICSTPLPTTALNPNSYGSTGLSPVAKNPPLDCFYVYPTVSRDQGLNSDLNVSEEITVTEEQFARFSGACRPFVPIYRQMTLAAVISFATGGEVNGAAALAYGDILNAFRDYLEHRNNGRPFVLVGHSQGALMLRQLIAREIDGKPLAKQMRLAILGGYDVLVPQGKLVGGSFKSIPLCSRPGQSGCVIAWESFRTRNPPPPDAMFGYTDQPGMTVACVNPARPGSTAWQNLDSYWDAHSSLPVPGGPIQWSTEGPPPTRYLHTEGLASGRCVNDGQRGYLEVRVNADPSDKRTDRIGGEVGMMGMFLPGWGMHLSDFALVQGDLIRAVREAGHP
jgi:hypothetical protein